VWGVSVPLISAAKKTPTQLCGGGIEIEF